jgi:DedD protein
MEKKKLLLVAVSVGVFLVIAISAAILISTHRAGGTAISAARPVSPGYTRGPALTPGAALPGSGPSAGTTPEAAGNSGRSLPNSADTVDMLRNADGLQSIQTPPNATAIQENHFYINGEKAEDSYTITKAGENDTSRVVINVPKPSTAAVPDGSVTTPNTAPRTSAPAAQSKPAAAAKPAAVKPAAAAKPAAAVKTYNDYWVQTGAFTAKVHAEGAKEELASKGITSIIENREVDGKTWYRVRVGPYTSENEAKYWLSLVKSIDGFGESQVRQTVAQR